MQHKEPVYEPGAPADPLISVVIPTYNRARLLGATLESLCRQTLPRERYEVIVADDGSSDRTREVAESFRERLRLRYTFQEDEGFRAGQARNLGVGLATAPVIAFLDTGVLVAEDWLTSHLRVHDAAGAPVVVAGYLHGNDNQDTPVPLEAFWDSTAEEIRKRYTGVPHFSDIRLPEIATLDNRLDRERMAWHFCWTANLSIPAAEFRAIGGFDGRYRGWGVEDVDLARRLQLRGCPVVWAPEAWAVEATHARETAVNWESCKRNSLTFYEKSPEPRLELFWAVIQGWADETLHEEWEFVRTRLAPVPQDDLTDELDGATRVLPAKAPGLIPRVAVIGCGDSLPGRWRHAEADFTLVDLEAESLQALRPERDPDGFQRVNAIGLRTPFADGSFDVVVLTSRLRGVWPRWGRLLLAEAGRIGGEVRVAPGMPPAAPLGEPPEPSPASGETTRR